MTASGIVATSVVVETVTDPPTADALSFVNILFDRPGTTARFGPNELVEIMAGNINYIGGKTRVFGGSEELAACTINAAGTGPREYPGTDDKLQPFADIYIVPSGQQPTNGDKLEDVNDAPNAVFGGLGGTFLFEPLGLTFPTGKISAGVYGLVIDECQNGYFDTGEDSYVDDAFWVDLDQDVPPLSPAAEQFQELKRQAGLVNQAIEGWKELQKFQEVLEQVKKAQDFALPVITPQTFVVFIINGVVSYIQDNSPYEVAKKELKETMRTVVERHADRFLKLHADPPQANFQRPAVPISAGAYFEDSSDPVTEALARYTAHQDAVSAITGALLDAIERYQGADQVGDAQWALRHARTIEELVPIYAGLTTGLEVATTNLKNALTGLSSNDWNRFTLYNRAAQDAIKLLASERSFFVPPDLSLQSEVLNTGADPAVVRALRDRWVANDSDAAPGVPESPAQWAEVIDNASTALAGFATAFAGMDDLVAPNIPLLETELGDLDQDPVLAITTTGTASAGASVALAVGPTDPATTYDWDLDADGDFDDATGASVTWTVPGDAMVGVPLFVSVRGRTARTLDSAIAVVTVAPGGNVAPAISSRTVNSGVPRLVEVAPGDATAMAVVASDVNNDVLSYTWRINGEIVAGATSPSYTFTTPTDRLGTFYVEVDVSDGQATTNTAFFIWSRGPDLDSDGYQGGPLGPDCLDDPALQNGALNIYPLWANPAAPERLNLVDDNCNGIVDDIIPGFASLTYATTQSGVGLLGDATEGMRLRLRADRWGHPSWSSQLDTFRLTVNWDDGSPVDSRDVRYDPAVGWSSTTPDFFHTYDDQLSDLRIEFCWEWITDPTPDPVLGNEKQCSATTLDVVNDRPMVNAADFRTWMPTQRSTRGNLWSSGDWVELDPVGKTLYSLDNANNFVIRSSTDLLGVGGYGRAAINHEVLGNGDDDDIGVLFGYDPDYDVDPVANNGPEGEFYDPDADVIGLLWMNPYGSNRRDLNPSDWCPGAPNVVEAGSAPKAFTLWRQHGQTNSGERGFYRTFDYPESTDPRCNDDFGMELLAEVPGTVGTTGLITSGPWRPRFDAPVANSVYADITEPYLVEYDYQPRSITVWVNGVQQLRYDVPLGDDDLPPSRLSVVMESQADMNVNASRATPVFEFVQGKGGEFHQFDAATGDPVFPDGITMPMHDGAADTHEARIDWGDGETTTAGVVTARPDEGNVPDTGNGWFEITGDHVYQRAGTFTGNVCVTDDEGLSMCAPFVANVANRAPRVDAGPDIAVGADVSLSDITFQDPGPFDNPYTATIDWGGDGPSVPVVVAAADIATTRGGGTITGTHSFTTDGPTVVRVCVTDRLGAEGCDERTLDVRVTDVAPVATLLAADGVEGDAVDIGVGITDANVDDAHTITVDWGDGSGPEDIPVAQSLVGCTNRTEIDLGSPAFDIGDLDAECGLTATAAPSHVYADDGDYTVTVEVCDSQCVTKNEVLTITNSAPTVVVATPTVSGRVVDIAGTYADQGVRDTHRLTVEWGNGATTNVPVTGGTLAAAHTYVPATTSANVTVCVIDDDNAQSCDTRVVALAPAAPPITPPATPKVPFLVSLNPARLLETRDSATIDGLFRNLGPLAGGTTIEVQITGRGGVPATGVDAAVLNVGALTPTGDGFLTIYPCGTLPNASSLNYTTGVNIPNEIIAKLSPTGTVCIYTFATTGLITDVVGYIPTT